MELSLPPDKELKVLIIPEKSAKTKKHKIILSIK